MKVLSAGGAALLATWRKSNDGHVGVFPEEVECVEKGKNAVGDFAARVVAVVGADQKSDNFGRTALKVGKQTAN